MNLIIKLLKIILRPKSLASVKIRLFPILVTGVTLDYFITYDFSKHKLNFSSGSDFDLVSYLLIGVFIFLILIDYWDRRKVLKQRDKELELLKDPKVPAEVKFEIAKQLDLRK